jgi:DNA-binding XRE family transcriptional regulator
MTTEVSEIRFDGAKITKARGSRTLNAIASQVGITRQALWQIENGKTTPSADVLLKICRVLDLGAEDMTKDFCASGVK